MALGSLVRLFVEASGSNPLRYQWRLNGENIRGATNAIYTIPELRLVNAGSYTVAVGNSAGSIVSDSAVIRIANYPLLELVDNFDLRRTFTDPEGTGTTNNVRSTVEANEPRHAGKVGGKSLWLSWEAVQDGSVTISTEGSSFDTLLAVYQGNTLADTRRPENQVASDEDNGGFLTSKVTFNARGGQVYDIAVDGFNGQSGNVILSWKLLPVASDQLPPEIAPGGQPVSQTVPVGQPAQFTVSQVTPSAVSYQWLTNGVALAGQTQPILRINPVEFRHAALYQVRITAGNGQSVVSRGALLEVVPAATFDVVNLSADKWEDLFDQPENAAGLQTSIRPLGVTSISVGYGAQRAHTRGSTHSITDPKVCEGVVSGPSRWFRFRVQTVQPVSFDTTGSEISVVLAAYSTDAFRLDPVAACSVGAAVPARIAFRAMPTQDYLVMVAGLAGSEGAIQLNWTAKAAFEGIVVSLEDGHLMLRMAAPPGIYLLEEAADLHHWRRVFDLSPWQVLFCTKTWRPPVRVRSSFELKATFEISGSASTGEARGRTRPYCWFSSSVDHPRHWKIIRNVRLGSDRAAMPSRQESTRRQSQPTRSAQRPMSLNRGS